MPTDNYLNSKRFVGEKLAFVTLDGKDTRLMISARVSLDEVSQLRILNSQLSFSILF